MVEGRVESVELFGPLCPDERENTSLVPGGVAPEGEPSFWCVPCVTRSFCGVCFLEADNVCMWK